ncbi:MAG: RluA family pseudouridine synthase [Treponema sp.]|nr:RluA family pseudouridine synthase [Treponema sp.]
MPCFSHNISEQLISPIRLDRYISENLCLMTRSQIKARNVKAKLKEKAIKLSYQVKYGDFIELSWDDQPPIDLIPENIPLEIIFENERCIVVNKAQGMVVHPAAGNRSGTLANALYFRKLQKNEQLSINNERLIQQEGIRPGIVHRLDKDTSGIIIAAWDDEAHAFLSGQFKSRRVKKNYAAIVCGAPKEIKGCIDTYIARDPKNRKRFSVSPNGKHAITFFKVVKKWQGYSLLLLRPKTGRTHQIRVHLRHIGCPILGDPIYGCDDKQFPKAALMLHSKRLEIALPGDEKKRVFSSNLPERFLEVIEKLNRIEGANG